MEKTNQYHNEKMPRCQCLHGDSHPVYNRLPARWRLCFDTSAGRKKRAEPGDEERQGFSALAFGAESAMQPYDLIHKFYASLTCIMIPKGVEMIRGDRGTMMDKGGDIAMSVSMEYLHEESAFVQQAMAEGDYLKPGQKEKLVIRGGNPLRGEIYVGGAKNAAVALIPAMLLSDGPCTLENVPHIEDVQILIDTLVYMGAKVDYKPGVSLTVDPTTVTTTTIPLQYTEKLRASYYFAGVLLGKYGHCEVGLPGGCNYCARPIDYHIRGFQALGAEVNTEEGAIQAKGCLQGATYNVHNSVGATINMVLAAVRAPGVTVLQEAAQEPHVINLCNYLRQMGAKISHVMYNQVSRKGEMTIQGVDHLHSASGEVDPDQIEAGTLMIAAAATRGEMTIYRAWQTHLDALIGKLLETGVVVDVLSPDVLKVRPGKGRGRSVMVETDVFPGFPTDLQQPMTAFLTTLPGRSTVVEKVFEDRFTQLEGLCAMGARIEMVPEGYMGHHAFHVEGVHGLHGAQVRAKDLRAAASLVIAGLMADGTTEILDSRYLDRGYQILDTRLRTLGASIARHPE